MVLISFANIGFSQNTISSIHDDIVNGETLVFIHSENIKGNVNPGPIDGCFILTKDNIYQDYEGCDLSGGQLWTISKMNFSNNKIQLDISTEMYGDRVNVFMVIEKHRSGWLVKSAYQSSKDDFVQVELLAPNYTYGH